MSQPPNSTEHLRRAFLARYPIILLATSEERRAERLARGFASRVIRDKELPVIAWSFTRGFHHESGAARTRDPVVALETVQARTDAAFYLFFDLEPHLTDPAVVRAIKETYDELRGSDRFLILIGEGRDLPAELARLVHVVELELPDGAELHRLVAAVASSTGLELTSQQGEVVTGVLRGLTLDEASHALQRAFRLRVEGFDERLVELARDKGSAVRRAGYLEFVQGSASLDEIGGLENLKSWLEKRRYLFSQNAFDQGLPVPRGMLVMGMSGCGKSLAAKAVSQLWGVPLFRLDMSLISSGLYGTPEAAFDRALKTVAGLAPTVLWIDEIENSLGMDDAQGQGNQRVFSSFLTWMQEKPPLVFVAATANRISSLPAEVIRKGRFDQVFFVDLPTKSERSGIFEIHLRKQGGEPTDFDLELLAAATRGWNGAEIEQAVAAARVDAFNEDRPFHQQDVTRNTAITVPLSKTMHEQMKRIRSWAFGRAVLASGEKYSEAE